MTTSNKVYLMSSFSFPNWATCFNSKLMCANISETEELLFHLPFQVWRYILLYINGCSYFSVGKVSNDIEKQPQTKKPKKNTAREPHSK